MPDNFNIIGLGKFTLFFFSIELYYDLILNNNNIYFLLRLFNTK